MVLLTLRHNCIYNNHPTKGRFSFSDMSTTASPPSIDTQSKEKIEEKANNGPCPHCGAVADLVDFAADTVVDDNHKVSEFHPARSVPEEEHPRPAEGMINICFSCCGVSIFTADGKLRLPNVAERANPGLWNSVEPIIRIMRKVKADAKLPAQEP